MIIFVDFEASSLMPGSWPVEIGWAIDGGVVESHLIWPPSMWRDWDPKAEIIHGLSRGYLQEHGEPADAVASRAVEVLGAPGVAVFSDAAGWDQMWLDRLLEAGGLPRDILVHPAVQIYRAELGRLRELAPPQNERWHEHVVRALEAEAAGLLQDVYAAEMARNRARHRAGPDAEGMRWILHELCARVDARLDAARS